jgi:hypothetical protein
VEHVSRNEQGYVDFEKMKLLEGIALINVVVNPDNAGITGSKKLQTRITHNDGKRLAIMPFFSSLLAQVVTGSQSTPLLKIL